MLLKVLQARLKQGHRTSAYPRVEPTLPDRFRGGPLIDPAKCRPGCRLCVEACPTGALGDDPGQGRRVDLGRCLFCLDCGEACPAGALTHRSDHRLAARRRESLLVPASAAAAPPPDLALAEPLKRLLGRSLKLRQVSAGGCNACEADANVLSTIVFDLGRFGIQFVASPRHADGLLVTGPVTENMRLALLKTWAAVPEPKIVIAVGACAISGGPFRGRAEVHDGVAGLLPVDLYVPGCPPHPLTILHGLLGLIRRG